LRPPKAPGRQCALSLFSGTESAEYPKNPIGFPRNRKIERDFALLNVHGPWIFKLGRERWIFFGKTERKKRKFGGRPVDFRLSNGIFDSNERRQAPKPGIFRLENAPIPPNPFKTFFRTSGVTRRRRPPPSSRSPWRETLPRLVPERRGKDIAPLFRRARDFCPRHFSAAKPQPRAKAGFSPKRLRDHRLRRHFALNVASSRPPCAFACLFRCFCISFAPCAFASF
jgi:hypothetical protein